MKKLISLFLALLFIVTVCPAVHAETTGIEMLKVNPYGGEEDAIDTVRWFVSGKNHFLFLPADADPAAAKAYITASDTVTLDGSPIASGEPAAFSVGAHTLVCGGESVKLTVLQSSALPAIFIETESGSLDTVLANKENKEAASIRVYENGVRTLDSALKSIKGRGHSTWDFPKKPFNIKFDKKTALLGMPKAKKWSLLANYLDHTGIRTPAALTLAAWLGIPSISECRNADLYLNGEYYGNFSVCESVEVADSRVEITDLEKRNETANPGVDIEALSRGGTGKNNTVQSLYHKGSMKWVNLPNDPENISGGYLLELDFANRYQEETSGFVSDHGQWVVVKSPEYASEAEVRYIAGLYNEAEEALYSETGYNTIGKYYTEYFDMETLAKTYLFLELQKSIDSAISSFFFYKDADSDLLIAAPVWDFDHGFYAAESRCGCDFADPDGWSAAAYSYCRHGEDPFDTETVLSLLFRHADFRLAAAEAWNASVLATAPERIETLFRTLYEENLPSRQMDLVRWIYPGSSEALKNARSIGNAAFEKMSSFVRDRIAVLHNAFQGDLAMLYYDANGGTGHVFNREIAFVGDKVTVLNARVEDAYIEPPAGKVFCGWNTRADGTGTAYRPGAKIRLRANTVTLYAMWGPPSETEEPAAFWPSGGETGFLRRIIEWVRELCEDFIFLYGRNIDA